ncbi:MULTISPECIES: DUF3515 family protein [unclassified Streptomyces]|uniref:DUF3515 family protein n=1 Tax=unclassified Streptomyces TaxID=2593676 RepID=UPI00190729C2|nr:DUF3515 family protein [Streptomyces sp. HSG2]
MTRPARSVPRTALALSASAVLFAGCDEPGGYVLIRPPFAATPACDRLMESVPAELGGHKKRSGLRGAVPWGDGDIILYCGMPEPDATADRVAAGGVDWVAQEPADRTSAKIFATYGRDSTVQVRFREEDVDVSSVLTALAPAVRGDVDAGGAAVD